MPWDDSDAVYLEHRPGVARLPRIPVVGPDYLRTTGGDDGDS